MPNFSINLSLLFKEHAFLDRFQAAADAGFKAVEIQFPYDHEAAAIKKAADEANVEIILINVPVDDLMQGGNGLACQPERIEDYEQALMQCVDYAKILQPKMINVLAGREKEKARLTDAHRTFIRNLRHSAEVFDSMGITTVFEAVNKIDMPGFLVHNLREQIEVLEEAQHPNIRLQYDVYHMTRMGEHVIENLYEHAHIIGHIQFADAPGRAQPGTGEIDFDAVFNVIDKSIYSGWVGAEYNPQGTTQESLGWFG